MVAWKKLKVYCILVVVSVQFISAVLTGCSSEVVFELEIPEALKKEIEEGIPSEQYAFYVYEGILPIDLGDFLEQGFWFGPERPPIITEIHEQMLEEAVEWVESMSREPVPRVITKFSIEEIDIGSLAVNGYFIGIRIPETKPELFIFYSREPLDVVMTANVSLEESIEMALHNMKRSPGIILLTKRGADFIGKEDMVRVVFR